tara:strand:- start:251 stop:2494 length:2244 start_codon:yes stop_codon:yes gene_type:complete
MLGLVLLGPAVPRFQTAALAEDLNDRNAEDAAASFADVREYLFTGIRRNTELCCATAIDENVRYVQIYKSNTQGFCSMLESTENSSKPSLPYSRLKELWATDSTAKECRDAFTFTFVREPLDHFISGSSEIAFRFHRNSNKERDFGKCSMPPLSCYSWAAPSLNVTQRARAFIEDFAWGKLNSPCCKASRETDLHIMPQTAFVMDALDGRLGTAVPRIDVIGKLESVQEDWSRVAAAVRGMPAQYVDDEVFHEGSDANSGNEFRTTMEDLLRDDSSISSETRDAFCHQLRYDYACFGYIPDRVCAHASPEALDAKCPLAVAAGSTYTTGGTYVTVDGYRSWYTEQQIQVQQSQSQQIQSQQTQSQKIQSRVSGWAFHANACPAGHRSAGEGECLAAVLEAAQALRRPILRKWLRVVDDGADDAVPSGCSYSSVSKRALFNRNPDGRSSSEYEPVCLDEGQQTSTAGDVGLRTAVIPIADYIGFDFELVAETDLDTDGVAPDIPDVFRTLQVFRAKTDVAQVALIHVGKCASWTVRDTLVNNGITVWEYHMRQPEFSDLEKRKTAITTRDPLDRVVSAFNWRHPSNDQIHNNPFGASADPEEAKLYHCFDSAHAFAEALDIRNTTTCAELARTMLTGPKSKRGRWSLMGDDTQWYLERVMSQLRQGELDFTLTHVANLDADVNYAVQWITDTPETQSVELASVHNDDYPKKFDTGLSRAGRQLLRAALQPEYDFLDELEKLAVKPNGK